MQVYLMRAVERNDCHRELSAEYHTVFHHPHSGVMKAPLIQYGVIGENVLALYIHLSPPSLLLLVYFVQQVGAPYTKR